MVVIKHTFLKRIVVMLTLFMLLLSFVVSAGVEAASTKTRLEEGGFYYKGTTEGAYVVTQSFWDWLIEALGQILDFLLGLMTMGNRMVFVGWAVIIEELVTGLLEATAGVPMEIDSTIDPSNIDGAVKTSNNVTLEAIVYNQIPILDVNIFSNLSATCVSGTGNFFIECEACYEKQQEEIEAQAAEEGKIVSPTAKPTSEIVKSVRPVARKEKICKMKKCECKNCWEELKKLGYLETVEEEEEQADGSIKKVTNYVVDEDGQPVRKANAITIIKSSVSKWYYILRLIAIVAMLCILISVGIKMAISTIASEKALYKRMLVDWIAGMILLFTIHYFMVGIINLNELMVDFIEKTSRTSSAALGKEFGGDDKDNAEMEIGLYQAVRTRAYDAKLINGTTGTILYITLVFYTVKFVIIYLKRYLTLIVLTLMSPGIGVAYAIQKVMSGKSQAFGKWLHEYFINVFIQTVHALVYTIFVSTALEISLNSISGSIIAFVFINFMLKGDDIFRKIFKLSGASTEGAMNADKDLKQKAGAVKSAYAFMTAGNLLNKTPIAKAIRAPIKAVGTGVVLKISKEKYKKDNSKESIEKRQQKNIERNNRLNSVKEELKDLRKSIDPEGRATKEFKNFVETHNPLKEAIGEDGQDAMEKELMALEDLAKERNISTEDREKLADLRERFDKDTNITAGQVFKAKIGQIFDAQNYYDLDKNGNLKLKRKPFIGNVRFDRTKNKNVRETLSDLVKEQLFPSTRVGISETEKKRLEEDKKMLKEILIFGRDTFVGMGALFVGLGTVVSNPAVGMGLLATGINSRINYYDKMGLINSSRCYKQPKADDKQRRFSFKRFNKGARKTISKSMIAVAENEKDKVVVENVRKRHSKLYKALSFGTAGLRVSGAVFKPVAMAGRIATVFVADDIQRVVNYSPNSLFGKLSAHHFKQLDAWKKEVIEDEIRISSKEEAEQLNKNYNSVMEQFDNFFKDDKEATDEEKEQRMMDEALALKRGEAVKLGSGEVVVFNTPEKNVNNLLTNSGMLKDNVEREFIEEAVSRLIIDAALDSRGIENFSESNISNEARNQIIKKLESYGMLDESNAKVENLIPDLNKKIDVTIDRVINQELKGNSDSSTSTNQTSSGRNSEEKLSKFDEILIETVIKDKAESGEIKNMSEVSTAMITESVTELKAKVMAKKASDDVVKKMQQAKEALKPSNTNATDKKIIQEEHTSERKIDNSYEEASKVSEEKKDLIKKRINEVKKQNNTTHLKSETERREDKAKKIQALDALLAAEAMGEEKVYSREHEDVYKSTDEIIQELFEDAEQQLQVYELLTNVSEMRRLNKRANNAKIDSNNPKYNKAKKEEKERKSFNDYQKNNPSGDMVYANGDGRKNLASKETYGPITDIESVLKDIISRRKKN